MTNPATNRRPDANPRGRGARAVAPRPGGPCQGARVPVARRKGESMSENPTTPNPDALEEAIAAFRRMPVPERPADDDLLARLTAGQETRTVPIPRPSARKVSLRAVISCVAAAAILLAFLGWFLFNPGDSVAL